MLTVLSYNLMEFVPNKTLTVLFSILMMEFVLNNTTLKLILSLATDYRQMKDIHNNVKE